jgi:hypothetical protein
MKTTIEHKYSIGDKVYIIVDNMIKSAKVKQITITVNEGKNVITYILIIAGDIREQKYEEDVHKSITTT